MGDPVAVHWACDKGYWPNQNKFLDGTLISGSNVFVRSGAGGAFTESAKGFSSTGQSSGGANPLMNVSSSYGGMTGGGSGTQAFAAGVYFFAGSGSWTVNGSALGAAGSSVTIYANGSTFNAGLQPPGSPTIADSGAAGHNDGSYSVAFTSVRSTTGGESTIGPPSNVLAVHGHGIKVTAAPSIDAGADKVGIYATRRGFGSVGPYYHLYDLAKASIVNHVINVPGDPTPGWLDSQLGDLAPLDFNPPPPCTFCLVINSVCVAVGAYGGAGLHASYPNKPEAYPAKFAVFLPGGGVVTACKATGFEGAVMVATAGSLNLVTASATPLSPISIRQIWPQTGVPSGNQFCVAEDMIYAFLGGRGAVRSSYGAYSGEDLGENSSTFAEPVASDLASFGAGSTVVAYDPANDCIWYMNGSTGLPYCRHTGMWSTPQVLPGSVTTAVTSGGRMLISVGGTMYSPELGSGTTWNWISNFTRSESLSSFPKTVIGLRATTNASARLDIMVNPDSPTITTGGANINVTTGHGSGFTHLNCPDVKAWAVKASGTGSQQAVYEYEAEVIVHAVRAA